MTYQQRLNHAIPGGAHTYSRGFDQFPSNAPQILEKGKGAYLNDKRISVSKENNISKSLLVTGFPYDTSNNRHMPVKVFAEFVNSDIPVRRLGSAALDLCWTACGRFDGFWEYYLNPWDVAAGYLIVTEAGGVVTDFEENEFSVYKKEILATNGLIHDQMLRTIQKVKKPG